MQKSNALLLTFDFPPALGGISILMAKITICLKEEGIIVLTTKASEAEEQEFDSKADFPVLRRNFTFDVANWRLPLQLIKTFSCTLKIYSFHRFKILLVGQVFPFGLVGLIFKVFFRVPFITFSHGSDSLFSKNKIRDFLVGAIFRSADRVICFSDYTRRNLLKWNVKEDNIKKVSIGVDSTIFRPDADISEVVRQFNLQRRKVLLTVNRLSERKGIDSVIKSLADLTKEEPSIIYLVVGEGKDEHRLKDLVRNLNLDNYVKFVGAVAHEKLPQFYAACDIFINAVREIDRQGRGETEGFGLVNIEASACAKPVIAGATGGVVDAVLDNKTGLLINPTSSDELKQAILRLLRDNEFARKLGETGRQMVLEKFNLKNMKKDLTKILESLDYGLNSRNN
ncbi:MAG: glycosyltransferase family 4 protein [Candidatus Omnitrophota bacterium]